MEQSEKPPRFLYHGEALAANAILTGPIPEVIEVQAASCLPVSGGTARAEVRDFAYSGPAGNVLSFRRGYTQTLGYYIEEKKSWSTVVTSTVEDLNILDMVTAKRVVARIFSRHGVNDLKPTISVAGSTFTDLRIGGREVEIEWETDAFDRAGNHDDLLAEYRKGGTFQNLLDSLLLPEFEKVVTTPELTGCTLVRSAKCGFDQVKFEEGAITIPNFGALRLAELIIKPYERTLTMIQVELSSPPSGKVTAGAVRTNGSPAGGGKGGNSGG